MFGTHCSLRSTYLILDPRGKLANVRSSSANGRWEEEDANEFDVHISFFFLFRILFHM